MVVQCVLFAQLPFLKIFSQKNLTSERRYFLSFSHASERRFLRADHVEGRERGARQAYLSFRVGKPLSCTSVCRNFNFLLQLSCTSIVSFSKTWLLLGNFQSYQPASKFSGRSGGEARSLATTIQTLPLDIQVGLDTASLTP